MVTNKEENATCSSENSHAVGESIKSKPSADEDDVCDATSSVIISRDYSEGSNIERSDQIPQNQKEDKDSGKEKVQEHHPPFEENDSYTILLDQLIEFGFDKEIASIAISRVSSDRQPHQIILDKAINWIFDHLNSEEVDEMGGTSSMIRSPFMLQRPTKMVFVANMELKMGIGKLAAQVGHATLSLFLEIQHNKAFEADLNSWLSNGSMKIVLKGRNAEELIDLFKKAKEAGLPAYIIQDAGRTQIAPGSRTVLGIFGSNEEVDKITGELKLL